MKRPSAYYLILLYALAVCKPFLPWVSDLLAHTFWETAHLESVHQHHKNHLGDELKQAAKEDQGDANAAGVKSNEPVAVHLLTEIQVSFPGKPPLVKIPVAPACSLANLVLEKHIPPPKALHSAA